MTANDLLTTYAKRAARVTALNLRDAIAKRERYLARVEELRHDEWQGAQVARLLVAIGQLTTQIEDLKRANEVYQRRANDAER
jgi:hypothetical protein